MMAELKTHRFKEGIEDDIISDEETRKAKSLKYAYSLCSMSALIIVGVIMWLHFNGMQWFKFSSKVGSTMLDFSNKNASDNRRRMLTDLEECQNS